MEEEYLDKRITKNPSTEITTLTKYINTKQPHRSIFSPNKRMLSMSPVVFHSYAIIYMKTCEDTNIYSEIDNNCKIHK